MTKKEKLFLASDLIEAGPSVFGVNPEVMAGALYGVTAATKEEAEDLLKAFQAKEVK